MSGTAGAIGIRRMQEEGKEGREICSLIIILTTKPKTIAHSVNGLEPDGIENER